MNSKQDSGEAEIPPFEPVGERVALRAVAELLGSVLLRELEPADLANMRAAGLASSLSACGIELPIPEFEASWLEERAAEYHDLFLRPETGPLVQSLWTQGRYEGDATVRVRELAELAAVEYQSEPARGAAVDHLGSLLLLWSACDARSPAVAEEIVREHLDWAFPPLKRLEGSEDFYGVIAGMTRQLIEALTAFSSS